MVQRAESEMTKSAHAHIANAPIPARQIIFFSEIQVLRLSATGFRREVYLTALLYRFVSQFCEWRVILAHRHHNTNVNILIAHKTFITIL